MQTEEVYISTGNGGKGATRVVHLDENCGRLTNARGVRSVSPKAFPDKKICSYCGPNSYLNGVYNTSNGLCPKCDGRLDDMAECEFCQNWKEVFGDYL